ncbi:unnamed protein product [Periconia digitata]|uniref:Uncharacterized protein n=1 Tax=Periconia digitata TaxID=1303443 RepID=A0A9W4U4T4_9PLEO|nr:unnamed protein product [Periconia digitata]
MCAQGLIVRRFAGPIMLQTIAQYCREFEQRIGLDTFYTDQISHLRDILQACRCAVGCVLPSASTPAIAHVERKNTQAGFKIRHL